MSVEDVDLANEMCIHLSISLVSYRHISKKAVLLGASVFSFLSVWIVSFGLSKHNTAHQSLPDVFAGIITSSWPEAVGCVVVLHSFLM